MKYVKVVFRIVAIVVIVCLIQLIGGCWFLPSQVLKVEMMGASSCERPATKAVELTRGEIWGLLLVWDLSLYDGAVTGDSCYSDYTFKVYLAGGFTVDVQDANIKHGDAEVSCVFGSHLVRGDLLAWYAQRLIEKYDLAV